MLITAEGIDGSGKTCQLNLLSQWLTANRINHILTAEPGGEYVGKAIEDLMIKYYCDIDPIAELLLFNADRAQHVRKVIFPALEEGKIILCDRYYDSTYAYQGYARGLPLIYLQELNLLSTGNLKPDLTLLFDVDVEIAQERLVRANKDFTFDKAVLEFKNSVREGYLTLAEEEPDRIKIIDASLPVEDIFFNVLIEVRKLIGWLLDDK